MRVLLSILMLYLLTWQWLQTSRLETPRKMFTQFRSALKLPSQVRMITSKQHYKLENKHYNVTVYYLPQSKSRNTLAKTAPICYRFVQNRNNYYSAAVPFRNTILQRPKRSVDSLYALNFDGKGKNQFSTIVWLLGKPIAKFAAIIIGRSIRKKYYALSPAERQLVFNYLQENSQIPYGIIAFLLFCACAYYFAHLEETPITQRTRFVSFSHDDVMEIAKFQADVIVEIFKQKFIRVEDRRVKRTVNVARRLIDANPDIRKVRNQSWRIYVINEDIINAFVLPTGQIFVFGGILDLSETDDQLAIILGHEMAHAALHHGAEGLSIGAFTDWFIILGFGIIWSIIPSDPLALLATYIFDKIVDWVVYMPASRKQEWEADHVGLIFAANACYDIREAGVLWRKIAKQEQSSGSSGYLPVWMGTHPDSFKRAKFLDSLLTDAEGWRKAHGCPPLPDRDPRKRPI